LCGIRQQSDHGLPRQDGLAIMAPDVLLPMAGEPAMGS
jgi:hypothetical protein